MTDVILIPEDRKGYRCEMIADSIGPHGVRLTTMLWKSPLIIHAENCRHRCFSRSVASNRAIPTAKILAMVEQDPFLPVFWGKNQAGMSAREELANEERDEAEARWRLALTDAVRHARILGELGLHKQTANRILSPFQWVTEVVTGTDWANYFALRCHPDAQPEIRVIAEMARELYQNSEPQFVGLGKWHLPFVTEEERDLDLFLKKAISAARCARTSYRTHDGQPSTIDKDVALYDRLVGSEPRHASPCEHQATPVLPEKYIGNLFGWKQHRMEIPNHTVKD